MALFSIVYYCIAIINNPDNYLYIYFQISEFPMPKLTFCR